MAKKTAGRITGLRKTAKNWWARQTQVRGLPKGASRVAGRSATGFLAGLAVTETMGEMMKLLDNQLTQAARSRDNEAANAALGSYSEQTRSLRTAAGRLSPAEQKVYQRHLDSLLESRTFTQTANPLFNAKQLLTIMKTALARTSGRETNASKKWETEFERLQASNALSRANPGLSEEQAYRDSFGGTALGIVSGRTDIDKIPRGGKSLARVGRGLADPLGALKTGYRWATGDPEPSGPPSGYKVPGPGGTDVLEPMTDVISRAVKGFQDPQLALAGTPAGQPPAPVPVAEKQGLGGAHTFEDFTKAALTAAGFGTPEAKAYHYDPWGQTGGNAPYLAALAGGGAALNPRIVGGRAPEMRDIRGLHQGTQQSQKAYAAELDAQGQAMARNAMAPAGPAYAAYQKGEGLRQGLQVQQRQVDQREQVNFARTVYNRESQLLGKQYADGTIDEKAHNIGQTKLVDQFASVLRPTVEEKELALQQGG